MIKWDDIDFGSKTKGQVKVKCPACIESRSNKSDKSLYVSLDKGVGKCYHCDDITIKETKESTPKRNYSLPEQTWQNFTSMPDKMVNYFKTRGISQNTLLGCRITQEEYYQPALKAKVSNIVFNYFEGDLIVNKKYRSADKKFTQSKDTKNIFYGINDIIGSKEVYIVEGEFDKLSLWEIGIKNCISVPNGANDNDDVWINCEKYLSECEKFYIATDNDSKGDEVADKIAQRLGRWRCERVIFEGKDANEDLVNGVFTLENSLSNRKRYPVSGTFTTTDLYDEIIDLYRSGIPETIYPKASWFKGMERCFSVMRGHLITGTGIPSHGKSSFTDWYILNLINEYGFKASWFSPEHSPMALHKSKFISLFYGRPFFKSHEGFSRITEMEIKKYEQWSNQKIYLTGSEKGISPTWTWLLDKFKEQIYNYGIDIFVIDAFNKVLFDKSGNKKDLIDTVLTELTSFCQQYNVMIFLIAHPTKMQKDEKGLYSIPTLYDVSGSADFRNQTHDGFCIYRFFADSEGQENETKFINLKTKFNFQGEIGSDMTFKYHEASGRYYMKSGNYEDRSLIVEEQSDINYETGEVFKKYTKESDYPF